MKNDWFSRVACACDDARPFNRIAYQKTFDAIAAATSVSAGRVAISVIKFREAFGGAAPLDKGASKPAASSADAQDERGALESAYVKYCGRGHSADLEKYEAMALDFEAGWQARAALATAPAQSGEPVAWMVLAANTRKPCEVTLYKSETEALRQDCVIPLYTAPLPREAATDTDRVDLIHALQKALSYWMPKVFDDRSAHDANLLVGYEGETETSCWGDEMIAAVPLWTPTAERLPAEPGWYLAMLAPDNDWGLMSDTPLQVEFDAYKSKPKAFTCFYEYRGDEDITEAVTHWMPLPAAPAASNGEQEVGS